MTYSCSDFTDDVLETLQDMGLLRDSDYCGDDPQSQGNAVKSAFLRMQALLAFAKGLVGVLPTAQDQALRLALANLAGPTYLYSDHYGHCFVGSQESITRWVLRLSDEVVLAAQVLQGGVWKDLDVAETDDLLQDIRDNDVRRSPQDIGSAWSDELPAWVDMAIHAQVDLELPSPGNACGSETMLLDMSEGERRYWNDIHSGSRQVTLKSSDIEQILGSRDPELVGVQLTVKNAFEGGSRDRDIITLARRQREEEGSVEIDDSASVSEGDDNGAYVSAWVWVQFGGSPLDKVPD